MPSFLIDKSALARQQTQAEVREALARWMAAGEIATCGIIDLEILYSAASPAHYAAGAERLREMPRIPITEACVERALAVQGMLAARSQHRCASIPDLLIAACAELAGLTVLHYDADFERIGELTGQPTRWVVPRGSVS
jgi:predicted nucleic acid-binding protein